MEGTKISKLTPVTEITGNEEIPVAAGGKNYKVTTDQIREGLAKETDIPDMSNYLTSKQAAQKYMPVVTSVKTYQVHVEDNEENEKAVTTAQNEIDLIINAFNSEPTLSAIRVDINGFIIAFNTSEITEDSVTFDTVVADGKYRLVLSKNGGSKLVFTAGLGDLNLENGSGENSVQQRTICKATGVNAFATGWGTKASGDYSYTEGFQTVASDESAHAEGDNTKASKGCSHAEGSSTIADGISSHAEGKATQTTNQAEHAEGKYNKSNTNTLHSVGIGTSEEDRKNAHEIMQNGNHHIYGVNGYDGTNPSDATSVQDFLNNKVSRRYEIGTKRDYQFVVIPLWKKSTIVAHINGTLHSEVAFGGQQRHVAAEMDLFYDGIDTSHVDTCFKFITYGNVPTNIKLVTFTYQGEEWYGIQTSSSPEINFVFEGFKKNIALNQIVVYKYSDNDPQKRGVVNEEINNSIQEVPASQIQTLNTNVTSANKLNTPRSIFGQSFDGTSNVVGDATIGSIVHQNNEGKRLSESGWYTIYKATNVWQYSGAGNQCILFIRRQFQTSPNETYIVAVSFVYSQSGKTNISVTQLSGRANIQLCKKIRVVYRPTSGDSGDYYIQVYVNTNTENPYNINTIGNGTPVNFERNDDAGALYTYEFELNPNGFATNGTIRLGNAHMWYDESTDSIKCDKQITQSSGPVPTMLNEGLDLMELMDEPPVVL